MYCFHTNTNYFSRKVSVRYQLLRIKLLNKTTSYLVFYNL